MNKIIEMAHLLGEEIAKSEEIKVLEAAKNAYEMDSELQAKMSEYETDRILLTKEINIIGSNNRKTTIRRNI